MNNNNSKGVSYTTGFFMLIGFAILGFVLSAVLGAVLIMNQPGVTMANMEDALKDPNNAGMVRWVQTISLVISMLVPSIAVAAILNRKPFQLLGFKKETRWKQAGLMILIVFVSLFVAGGLGYLNKAIPVSDEWRIYFEKLETSYYEQVEIILDLKDIKGFLLSLVLMAFLPALCEEALFRGGLQNFLTRATKNPWLAIIIVSILFSLVHFSFYGFLPRVFLGMMLGFIFYYTGNLWLAIAAHFLNNALAVTAMYMAIQQGKTVEEAMKEDMGSYWYLLALPVLILLFMLLKKNSPVEKVQAPQEDNSIFKDGV